MGHPEELLGAALCAGAVLAAAARPLELAGVLLGLAVANKAWALLAVGPVLLALPDAPLARRSSSPAGRARVRAPAAARRAAERAAGRRAHTGVIFQPWQVWWFLGRPAM